MKQRRTNRKRNQSGGFSWCDIPGSNLINKDCKIEMCKGLLAQPTTNVDVNNDMGMSRGVAEREAAERMAADREAVEREAVEREQQRPSAELSSLPSLSSLSTGDLSKIGLGGRNRKSRKSKKRKSKKRKSKKSRRKSKKSRRKARKSRRKQRGGHKCAPKYNPTSFYPTEFPKGVVFDGVGPNWTGNSY